MGGQGRRKFELAGAVDAPDMQQTTLVENEFGLANSGPPELLIAGAMVNGLKGLALADIAVGDAVVVTGRQAQDAGIGVKV